MKFTGIFILVGPHPTSRLGLTFPIIEFTIHINIRILHAIKSSLLVLKLR
ncbi:unnamed protein product [Periconia digitata]|uniref:Uncharacterized protein n=1 Tax=Periconia digitata TaxID=1303443 RepID=A0A9W4XTC3_9PLEO|nr:unnamed protein product [Periconia digitata]